MTTHPPARHNWALHTLHVLSAKRTQIKWIVTLVLLALALHTLLPAIAGFGETWQRVRTLAWWAVAAAMVAEVGSYLGSGLLLQGLVRLGRGRLSVVRGAAITLSAGLAGLVAAGIVGSSVAMYQWIQRDGTTEAAAGLAVALKPVFNNAVLFAVGIYGIVHLLVLGDLTRIEATGFVVALVLLVALTSAFVWGAAHPAGLRRNLTALGRLWSRLRRRPADDARVERAMNQAISTWALVRSGGWERPLIGAVLNLILDALCLYLLFLAAGDRVGIGVLVTGYSLPLLASKVVLIPGGIGVVDAAMIAAFTTLGTDNATSVVAVLAYRLLSFWIPAVLGLPLVPLLQRGAPRKPPPADAQGPEATLGS